MAVSEAKKHLLASSATAHPCSHEANRVHFSRVFPLHLCMGRRHQHHTLHLLDPTVQFWAQTDRSVLFFCKLSNLNVFVCVEIPDPSQDSSTSLPSQLQSSVKSLGSGCTISTRDIISAATMAFSSRKSASA